MLLFLQDQISALESDLNAIDRKHAEKDAVDIHNGSFRQESDPRRTELILDIHQLLKEYSKQVSREKELHTFTDRIQMNFSFNTCTYAREPPP